MTQELAVTLHFQELGSGDAVVLIPGLAGLGKFWGPLLPLLRPAFRTLAIDHPGVGGSRATAAQSIAAVAAGVLGLLDRLGIQAAHVVGHSTGGLVAQALALDAPQRVRRVVLSSTWAQPDRRFRDLFRLRQHVLRTAGPAAYVALGELLAYPAAWYEQHLATEDTPDLTRAMPTNVALTLERIEMLLSYDRFEELGLIRTPTLVIGALDDNIVTFNHSQQLAARIQGARLVELSGGHFAPTTQTLAYARLITNFLGDSK